MGDINNFEIDGEEKNNSFFKINKKTNMEINWKYKNEKHLKMKEFIGDDIENFYILIFPDNLEKLCEYTKNIISRIVKSILSDNVKLYGYDILSVSEIPDKYKNVKILLCNIYTESLSDEKDEDIKKYFIRETEDRNNIISNLVSMVDGFCNDCPDKCEYNLLYDYQKLLRSQYILSSDISNVIKLVLELPKIYGKNIEFVIFDSVSDVKYYDVITNFLSCLSIYTDDKSEIKIIDDILDKKNYQKFYTDIASKLGHAVSN